MRKWVALLDQLGVSSDSKKKKSFHCLIFLAAVQSRSSFECMHVLQQNVRNFQHFAKKIILKCLLSESGRAEWENIWPRSSTHGPHCCRFVRHDFEPKTFLAGRPTQSIRAYYLLTQLIICATVFCVHPILLIYLLDLCGCFFWLFSVETGKSTKRKANNLFLVSVNIITCFPQVAQAPM